MSQPFLTADVCEQTNVNVIFMNLEAQDSTRNMAYMVHTIQLKLHVEITLKRETVLLFWKKTLKVIQL